MRYNGIQKFKNGGENMPLASIAQYVLRAIGFAAIVCALCFCIALVRKKRIRTLDLLAIGYVAALTEIIALRLHTSPVARTIQWIPLKTTLEECAAGWWSAVYHIAGNVAWFVPLGMILAWKKPA